MRSAKTTMRSSFFLPCQPSPVSSADEGVEFAVVPLTCSTVVEQMKPFFQVVVLPLSRRRRSSRPSVVECDPLSFSSFRSSVSRAAAGLLR